MQTLTVDPDGHLVIPVEALGKLDVHPGDAVVLSIARGSLILTPMPRDFVEYSYGLARDVWQGLGGSSAFVQETEEAWRI
jgi:hypothetical protein